MTTVSEEIRRVSVQLADVGYTLSGPAADTLLAAAGLLGRLAIDAAAQEEHVRRTEMDAARAAGLCGPGPRLVQPSQPLPPSSAVAVLEPLIVRVERLLEQGGRGAGLPALECRAAALLLRGAGPMASYAVRRAIECDVLEALASDLDLLGPTGTEAGRPTRGVEPAVRASVDRAATSDVVVPLHTRRPGARIIPIDDGRST